MDRFLVRARGKEDKNGNMYYTTVIRCPLALDLNNTVIHLFPTQDENGNEFCDISFKHHEQRTNEIKTNDGKKRRRNSQQSVDE